MKKVDQKLLYMVYAGLFASLTTLLTATLHIPAGSGYIHCGDAVIYLAATVLPVPYAAGAAAVGGMLADVISGYPVYAIPTFLIKGLMVPVFHLIGSGTHLRRIAALTACGLVSVLGYWFAAVILYGGWTAQLVATVPANCLQALGSAAVYSAISLGVQRMRKTE